MATVLIVSQVIFYLTASVAMASVGALCFVLLTRVLRIVKNAELMSATIAGMVKKIRKYFLNSLANATQVIEFCV